LKKLVWALVTIVYFPIGIIIALAKNYK